MDSAVFALNWASAKIAFALIVRRHSAPPLPGLPKAPVRHLLDDGGLGQPVTSREVQPGAVKGDELARRECLGSASDLSVKRVELADVATAFLT